MKSILFPLTELRNISNAFEMERMLVLDYQCPSTFKNPLTEFLSWHLKGRNLGIPWLSFKVTFQDFWQEPEEINCSYANSSHENIFECVWKTLCYPQDILNEKPVL